MIGGPAERNDCQTVSKSLQDTRHSLATLGIVCVVILASVATIGTFAVGAASGNTDSGEASFDVEITETNSPIVEGDTLVVEATVTNTGDQRDSQQIHLKDGSGEIVDSISSPALTLSPGESKQVTLKWTTEKGDSSDEMISLQSNDDYPWTDVDITSSVDRSDTGPPPEPEFETTVTSDRELTAVVGETVFINETVENVGSAQGEYVASLLYNGSVLEERTLDVPAGAAEGITFNHTFEQPGLYELTTGSESTVTIEVVLPMNATIDPVVQDDGSVVTAPITNAQPNSTITIPLANVSGGSSDEVTFLTNTLQFSNESESELDSFELTMEASETPPDGVESLPEHVRPITYLHTRNTDIATVANTSFEFVSSANHTTVYQYDSNASQWTPIPTTAVNETDDGILWQATTEPNSTIALGVPEAAFLVTAIELEERAIADGSTATVTANVANDGAAPGQYQLNLTVDGEPIDSKTVALEANESSAVSFSFTPDGPGEYEIAIDEDVSTTLTVEEATPTSTPTPTPEPATETETATETVAPTSTSAPDTETGTEPATTTGPGFTGVVALVALIVTALVLARRD